jgi:hypothetical protein
MKKQQQNNMRAQTAPVNYSLSATEQPNNLVFKLPEAGVQEKSYIHEDMDLDKLADLLREEPEPKTQNKKKKKKSKK